MQKLLTKALLLGLMAVLSGCSTLQAGVCSIQVQEKNGRLPSPVLQDTT